MQKDNLLYNWEALTNFASFLTLKDLLNTATLSKQFNLILKKYIKQQYSLPNNQNQNEFQLLRSLFNRKIYTYNKTHKFAQPNPSNFIIRNIECQEIYSVAETLDSQFKLIKTGSLLLNTVPQVTPLPHSFKLVKITDNGFLYCATNDKLYRYNLGVDLFEKQQVLSMKGEIQDLLGGYRYAIAVVRESEESVKLRIFDNNQKLQNFKDIETHFDIAKFTFENHIACGFNANYFIYNETLYQFNIKGGSINMHPQFLGKKIVKLLGGKGHFIAYQRVEELAQNWTTEEVIKFAQKEGFEDYIKIFKSEKVTGKILMEMDKKYMQEVLGIEGTKTQQKLALRLQDYNKENEQNYVIYGWGRAADGALLTNPSKNITKPIKIKLPEDCQIFKLCGQYTVLLNKKTNHILVNHIDDKTNKLEWKEVTNRKIWSMAAVDDSIVLIASANKEKVPQRETEQIVVQKKEKLRTAKNIIDKITWDEHLKAQEFKVGYLDKYEGILQIPFSELQQSEVKQYRIEYFKQGSHVVWDKKKRIDIL